MSDEVLDRPALVEASFEIIAKGSKSFRSASRLFDPVTRERAWLLYAWNVFGLATWLGRVTPLGLVPIHRTQPLWVPAACLLAAWSLDKLAFAKFVKPTRVALALLSER